MLLMEGMIFFGAMFGIFIFLLYSAYFTAIFLNAMSAFAPPPVEEMGITIWQSFFGTIDKGYILLLILAYLLDIYVAYKMPNVVQGFLNIGLVLIMAWIVLNINQVTLTFTNPLQGGNLMPTMTAVYTDPYIAYPLMAFTALIAVLNFRNPDQYSEKEHQNVMMEENTDIHAQNPYS